jgi:hypothetical protein
MISRTCLAGVAAACLAVLVPAPAVAVLIQTVTGTDNTTAPVGMPQFNNVGRSTNGLGTAIYLGDGWVITAGHVGGGGIVLATYTDLFVYRLQTRPVGLPTITIASAQPSPGLDVTMVGAGRNRGSYTEWLVNESVDPWVWTVTTGSTSDYRGYGVASTRAMRWGTNEVSASNLWFPLYYTSTAYNDVKGFATVFDEFPGTTEAQAVLRDSGGAVFAQNGSFWELAGVISTVGGFSGQPDPRFTAVFGSATFMADLSFYRPQIIAVVPEPGTFALAVAAGAALAAVTRVTRRR